MDTPWRMFSEVLTLCGRPHRQHSVICPSLSAQTGSHSAESVFGLADWNETMISFSQLLHNRGWKLGHDELQEKDNGQRTSTTRTHSRRLNMHTFNFSAFKTTATTDRWFHLTATKTSKQFVSHTHTRVFSVYIQSLLTVASGFTSYFRRAAGATLCTKIYIIHRNLLKVQTVFVSFRDKKLFLIFSLQML